MKTERLERFIADARARLLALGELLGGARTLRAVAPFALPLVLFPWLKHQLWKELDSPLFRDAVMSQYSGWCLRHGYKLYSDVGAPDGPFIHFLHAFMQLFVGITDKGCRHADIVLQLLGSGAMGALLAPTSRKPRSGNVLRLLAWAFLGVSLWLPWYFTNGWQGTIQRDAYYALFGYLGLVCVYASEDHRGRFARALAFIGAALCTSMIFTRQSGVIYTGAAALGLLFAEGPERVARIKAGALGAASAFVLMLLAIAIFGSLRGFGFWYFEFTFVYYQYWLRQDPAKLLTEEYTAPGLFAVVAFVGVIGAVATRAAPRRIIAFAFPPIMFLIAAALSAKGWVNHGAQVTAAMVPLQLLLLRVVWTYRGDQRHWSPVHMAGATLALSFVAYRTMQLVQENPYYSMAVPQRIDGDIVDAEVIGHYLHDHTQASDKVFLYGHEAHVLLYAERGPAVPYYVNILLNLDHLYRVQPPAAGQEPSPEKVAAIHALHARIANDMCARLTAKPPAAMVFLDGSLGTFGNGVAEVTELCPPIRDILARQYTEVRVGPSEYHVFLSNENAAVRDRPAH